MKIIGHRGAAGLAPENSLMAIRAAKNLHLEGIEIDVRVTRDHQLVVCHDANLSRLAGRNTQIAKTSLQELERIKLTSGANLISLDAAAKEAEDAPLVVEGKAGRWPAPLSEFVKNYKHADTLRVISFNQGELYKFKYLCPNVKICMLGTINLYSTVRKAKKNGFQGVDVHFLALSWLGYRKVKRAKLEIIVYGVRWPIVAKLIHRFFPEVIITTDFPHKMLALNKEIDG